MRWLTFPVVVGVVCLGVACNLYMPFDPATVFQPVDEAIQEAEQAFENAVADPLSAKPFPVIVGGDNERVFYATNLGDIRVNFPGPTNDVVIPGFFGPSNLYQYARKERDLIRPLVPGGAFFGMATDGQFIAYVSFLDPESDPASIVVADMGNLTDRVVFDGAAEERAAVVPQQLAVDDGRLAFVIHDLDDVVDWLRVEDLILIDPSLEIETEVVFAFDLRGNRLAYIEESVDGPVRVMLRDLSTDERLIVGDHLRLTGPSPTVFLGENRVVWAEPSSDGLSSVYAYDIPSGSTRLWADDVSGTLAGANDDYFVTEEYVERLPQQANKFIVHRYDADGHVRKLADFRADGLAGQVGVIGDRAVWVNPERKIVVAPLGDGDRISFRPF